MVGIETARENEGVASRAGAPLILGQGVERMAQVVLEPIGTQRDRLPHVGEIVGPLGESPQEVRVALRAFEKTAGNLELWGRGIELRPRQTGRQLFFITK